MRLPVFVDDGGVPRRPELLVWVQMPTGIAVAHEVVSEDDGRGLARLLTRSLRQRAHAQIRPPAWLRVAEHATAAELRNELGDRFELRVAPTPELDEIFEAFVASMPDGDDDASYLEGGDVSAASVARMFEAAAHLYRVAPWKRAADDEVLRMDIPAFGVQGACVSIIGALGESLGLVIFPSLLAFERILATADVPPGGAPDLGGPVLSLDFWRARDVPPSMRREMDAHGWTPPAPDAVPVVMHRERDGVPRPLTERDVRIATECAFAVASFFVRHREVFGGAPFEPVRESSSVADSAITVTLTAPYDADDFEAPAQLVPVAARGMPAPSAKVGRNDPCPCGSGKKYKKCCQDAVRTTHAQESKRAAVHDLDEHMVAALERYAMSRHGESWDAAASRFVRAAGRSEPLLGMLAAPWSVYVSRVGGARVVDGFLADHARRLTSDERAWLQAQQRAWLGIWEIAATEPGVGVTARDLLSGQTRRIVEKKASQQLTVRDAVLARVVDHEGASYFCGMYPRLLPPTAVAPLVGKIKRRARTKGDVPIEALATEDLGLALVKQWAKAVRDEEARQSGPRKLVNTDGEDLVLTTDHFDIEPGERARIEGALRAIDGIEEEEAEDGRMKLVLLRPGNAVHAHWDNTVVAHLVLEGERLRVETNSKQRADRLRALVEQTCAPSLRHRLREHTDPTSSAQRPGAPRLPHEPSAEEKQALCQLKQQHYRAWLDAPVPMLGGKTPRQAVRTATGRQRVDVLLRSFENGEHRMSDGDPFDFTALRAELGLDPTGP